MVVVIGVMKSKVLFFMCLVWALNGGYMAEEFR